MLLTMLKAKLHGATVTDANLNYKGSITIDKEVLEQSGIFVYEKVQIVNNNNGARFETYVIEGERGSGVFCLNGAAARLVQPGDKIIVMAYVQMPPEEAQTFKPNLFLMDGNNKILAIY